MALFLTGLAVIGIGAFVALAAARNPGRAARLTAAVTVAGCALGLAAAVRVLVTGDEVTLRAGWSVPLGSFYVGIDALSALFLVIIFAVCAFAAVYGVGYMWGASARQTAVAWSMFPVLVGAMALVVVARNGILFLMAWEAMAVSSFFLVTLNDRGVEVRNAGRIYLIASHLGTAFLLAFFLMLGGGGGSLDFDQAGGTQSTARAGALFVLALVGFGTKAGLMPLHVWLPEAHPAAPSHVSAVMSGVMIKMGVYGLLRFTLLAGDPAAWWGWTLIGIGTVSGVLGGLAAIANHDFKRVLAYHSVENIGIIGLGLGAGLLGVRYGSVPLAALGFGGAIFHTLNHAIFKSLLFLSAGAVVYATGTRNIDVLGGVAKRIPLNAAFFAVGAVAISGLPPLNGFMGEFLIFRAGLLGHGQPQVGAALAIALTGGLALIGALSAGAFVKMLGIVFLGSPRTPSAERAHEPSAWMVAPVAALAAACFGVALAAPLVLQWITNAASVAGHLPGPGAESAVRDTTGFLGRAVVIFVVLLATAFVLSLARTALLRRRQVNKTVTWDCGYAAPSARMQYTGSSFAEPVTTLFKPLLRTHENIERPSGLFPARASFHSSVPDPARDLIYRPAASWMDRSLLRLRWVQHGRVQLYVLYIAVTLLALLIWRVALS